LAKGSTKTIYFTKEENIIDLAVNSAKKIIEKIDFDIQKIEDNLKQLPEKIDTEKINRINVFLTANKNKQADIICDESIIRRLGQELPLANYKLVDLSDFIDKDIRIYD